MCTGEGELANATTPANKFFKMVDLTKRTVVRHRSSNVGLFSRIKSISDEVILVISMGDHTSTLVVSMHRIKRGSWCIKLLMPSSVRGISLDVNPSGMRTRNTTLCNTSNILYNTDFYYDGGVGGTSGLPIVIKPYDDKAFSSDITDAVIVVGSLVTASSV